VLEEEQRQWRVAQVVSKDNRHISLQSQRLAPDKSSAKTDKMGIKSKKGLENGVHGWEPITLEHGRFPVLYCNAHEISEAVTQSGDPSSSTVSSSGTGSNGRASPIFKSKRALADAKAGDPESPAFTAVSTEDLSTLPQLHEASIVHTLHRRATADPSPQVIGDYKPRPDQNESNSGSGIHQFRMNALYVPCALLLLLTSRSLATSTRRMADLATAATS